MFFYLGLTLFTVLLRPICSLLFQRHKNLSYVIAAGAALWAVSAFRDITVGTDTLGYFQNYQSVQLLGAAGISQLRLEPLYYYFMLIAGQLLGDYNAFLAVQSLFTIALFMRFIYKNSSNVCVSVLVFQLAYFYCASLNISRFWLGASIALIGYDFAKKCLFKKSCVFVVIGSLVHTTNLAFLVIYLLLAKKRVANEMTLVISILFALLTTFALNWGIGFVSMLFPRYSVYQDYSAGGSSGLFPIFFLLILIVASFSSDKDRAPADSRRTLLVASVVSIGYVISISSIWLPLMARFSYVFTVFLLLFIPELPAMSKRYGRLIQAITLLALAVYYMNLLNSNSAGVIPYASIFG